MPEDKAPLASVARRVREILEAVDDRISEDYGKDLPDEGAKILSIDFDAEDQLDVDAMALLESRGIARWLFQPGIGEPFTVDAMTSVRRLNADHAKATLALAARIDALEGLVDKLVGQNERLLASLATKPKELAAAPDEKKPKKAKPAKKGTARA